MAEKFDLTKERRALAKIIGVRVAKRWKETGVDTVGAAAAGKRIVSQLSDAEVLSNLSRLKRKQAVKNAGRGSVRLYGAQLKAAGDLGAKEFFIRSTRRPK